MSDQKGRGFRAILRTAITWGAAWAIAGGAIVAAIALFDPNPATESLPERIGMAAISGVAWGVRFGIGGAVVGTAFATVIRLGYRGRRLADINPARFGLLGAIVGGIGVPLYLQTMNILSAGGPIAWGLVLDDAPLGAVFGAAAAAGSILLARRAERLSGVSDHEPLDEADAFGQLPAGDLPEPSQVARSAPAEKSEAARRR